jgi:hypothetical protein
MPQAGALEGWYGHLRRKGDHPSLLARCYRSHGHGNELSHVEGISDGRYRHPLLPPTGAQRRRYWPSVTRSRSS